MLPAVVAAADRLDLLASLAGSTRAAALPVICTASLLVSFAGGWTCQALAAAAVAAPQTMRVDAPFDYTLYTADIFPWADGRMRGPVPDTKRAMAAGLSDLLRSASRRLSIASYGIQSQQWLLDELAELKDSGLSVHAVVDQERGAFGQWSSANFSYPDTPRLRQVLGPNSVLPDLGPSGRPRTSSIMHNKFIVADGESLWLGSANLSSTCIGAEYNANTALTIHSPELAEIFEAEFSRMFDDRTFSKAKTALRRRLLHYSDGTIIEAFFSPQDNALTHAVLPFIESARSTLSIGMFFFTDPQLVSALEAAVERGVRVRMIYDALAAAGSHSGHHALRAAGVDVRVENWGGKMHMKTAVADGRHVLSGSMNWTAAGNTDNDENMLVVRDAPRLARELGRYFDELWDILPEATGRDPRAEGRESINSCFDAIDNDHDGKVDSADPGCT